MHEVGLAQSMLQAALNLATSSDANRITLFNVEMTAAGHESGEALRLHFENLARGTIAEGARMDIAPIPARLVCLHCGDDFESVADHPGCPRCASVQVRRLPQDDFRLVSIDIE